MHRRPSPPALITTIATLESQVYLISDHVIKLYVEDGLEFSLNALGTELEFYSLLCKVDSPLKNHIPGVLASGILFIENGSYKIVPWDGKGVPDVIASCNLIPENSLEVDFPFGVWSKKKFEMKKARMSINELISSGDGSRIWPYIVTKRCKGKTFAELRETLSWDDTLYLASFLGEQLRNLHLLPFPSLNASTLADAEEKMEYPCVSGSMEAVTNKLTNLSLPILSTLKAQSEMKLSGKEGSREVELLLKALSGASPLNPE
ncbi:hypothetical protein TEA_005439 [Camellia sinensis var. sinensis]|uniref:Uncharacterized protein n=1 Tax=Camellia sinensis var. sinensis TaxID=542762 RepID=A0A4V3WMG9_CAMSN|nr:hypothetical protein TEA_005439 [Camellia sinensis var. sinensis]